MLNDEHIRGVPAPRSYERSFAREGCQVSTNVTDAQRGHSGYGCLSPNHLTDTQTHVCSADEKYETKGEQYNKNKDTTAKYKRKRSYSGCRVQRPPGLRPSHSKGRSV